MGVDKNLFPYDLAVVAIMKNAAPYIKEWLDYHLLAGANHFFIYDNESEDNFKEILQPYIDAGLVTYIFYPGYNQQMPVYNEAMRNFKFLCRYMTFVDDDEFIFPKSKSTITEVVDRFLSIDDRIAGIEFNWFNYGSSGQKKADFTRGVIERFTYRDANENKHTKTALNPRRVDFMWTPHFATYQTDYGGLNKGNLKGFRFSDAIVMNHYHTKSWEEYFQKRKRGDVIAKHGGKYSESTFELYDKNEVFDDGILKYRDARLKVLPSTGGGAVT